MEDKADPYIVMLDHRNTRDKGLLSPAQTLISRRMKMLLPIRESEKNCEVQQQETRAVLQSQGEIFLVFFYGDVVHFKLHEKGKKEWKKVIVWQRLNARSYHIKFDGELRRQNRIDLKKTVEVAPLPSFGHQSYKPNREASASTRPCREVLLSKRLDIRR